MRLEEGGSTPGGAACGSLMIGPAAGSTIPTDGAAIGSQGGTDEPEQHQRAEGSLQGAETDSKGGLDRCDRARAGSPDAMHISPPASPSCDDDRHEEVAAAQGPQASGTGAQGSQQQPGLGSTVQPAAAPAQQPATQVMGWPANQADPISSLFHIHPHAVSRTCDASVLTSHALAQLQRASEVIDRNPMAAHGLLTQAAAAAAVAAAVAASAATANGSTQPAGMATHAAPAAAAPPLSLWPPPLPWLSQQARMLLPPNPFLPPWLPTNAPPPAPGTLPMPPFPLPSNPSALPNFFGLPGALGAQGTLPPFPMPWNLSSLQPNPVAPGGSWPAQPQPSQPQQLQPQQPTQPVGVANKAADAQASAIVGSAPAACTAPWPAMPPSAQKQACGGAADRAANGCTHAAADAHAGSHHSKRRNSHTNGDLLLPSAALPSTAHAAGHAVARTADHVLGSEAQAQSQMGHGLGVNGLGAQGPGTVSETIAMHARAAAAQPSAQTSQRPPGARTFRFVVQAANLTWRAQVGHSENGLAKKYYGPPQRTAERAARDADQLLYKLRGPSFPLNLGLTPAQAAYVDTLTLDQLLEDLHAKKDRDERQGTHDHLAPVIPCPSPAFGAAAMDAASALVFMSQDHKAPWAQASAAAAAAACADAAAAAADAAAACKANDGACGNGNGNNGVWLDGSMSGPFNSDSAPAVGEGEEEEVKGGGGEGPLADSADMSEGDAMVCSDEGHDPPDECSPAATAELVTWRHAGVAPPEYRRKRSGGSLPTPAAAAPTTVPALLSLSGGCATTTEPHTNRTSCDMTASSMECNTVVTHAAGPADSAAAAAVASAGTTGQTVHPGDVTHPSFPVAGPPDTLTTPTMPKGPGGITLGTSLLSQHLKPGLAGDLTQLVGGLTAAQQGGMGGLAASAQFAALWPSLAAFGSPPGAAAPVAPAWPPQDALLAPPGLWNPAQASLLTAAVQQAADPAGVAVAAVPTPVQLGQSPQGPGLTIAPLDATSHHTRRRAAPAGRPEPAAAQLHLPSMDSTEPMSGDKRVPCGASGASPAGSGKPNAGNDRPPYRYIVKIGSRWRAQVGQVDGGVQRKYYGPYLDDPLSAALDADKILYKLRGPSAVTNLPLSAETKAQLDCMTLSQLLQSFKNFGSGNGGSAIGGAANGGGGAGAAHANGRRHAKDVPANGVCECGDDPSSATPGTE